ncbi:protein kinase domain-containing protein [Streptosporangium sp. CA-135522]|uniref:protein kinase domain-containing protein n=1 Tax=Streptosporangium sp. CA-135522 TaxID=3240072 RepID=UPI003D8B4E03
MDNVAIRGIVGKEGDPPGDEDVNHPAEGLRPGDPEQVGGYRLLGRLGEGGMGTVYLGLAPTGRQVAVKMIKAEFAVEDGFAVRFHAEVDNARRVASFCTAQVLDDGTGEDGRPYMVTEYIAGTPLSRQIALHGPLEPGPLHGVALGVAAALAAIHVAGLVHRDLKPANVILSMSGPRVIDFGIARALDSTQGFTLSGEVLGSPGWWAPEQVRGLEITPAADVFAWGCLVAYAGNGRHPYGRGDLITMATRLLNSPPDLGALPAPLDDLVRRATTMDPHRRPTAQDLLIALVGGGIAAPAAASVPADPPTLVATDMLSRSWRPPANVEPDSTRTFGMPGVEGPSTSPGPDPATTPSPTSPPTPSPASPPHTAAGPSETPSSGTAPASLRPPPVTTVRERPPRRRLRLAVPAVATALAATIAVLVAVLVNAGGTGQKPRATTGTRSGVTDVGRRIATGSLIEDPQLIIPRAPRCDLTGYQGATSARGRFCVIGWILLNTGGKAAPVSRVPLTLVDDRGVTHAPEPVSTGLSGILAPGGKMEGVLVYDLPPARRPLKLTGRVIEGGGKIEVRLS